MLIFLIMYLYIHFLGVTVLDCIEINLQSMFLSLDYVCKKLFYLLKKIPKIHILSLNSYKITISVLE